MPDVSGVTVVTNARVYYHHTRGCGRTRRPAFPAPSEEGGKLLAKLGRFASRECEGVLSRHCERSEAIHSAAQRKSGLLRGACHRARIRATRWLAMTAEQAV